MPSAHRFQMRRFKLTIDESAAILLQETCQKYQRDLTGTGNQREHAFAKEATAYRHAIDSTHKQVIIPDLHTGGKALFVKLFVSRNHVISQPCTLLLDAQIAAIGDDAMEILVEGTAIAVLVHQFAHGMGHMYLRWENDESVHRTKPPYLLGITKGIPRENAIAVCQQQTVHTEVAADSKETVGITQMWVGKRYVFI